MLRLDAERSFAFLRPGQFGLATQPSLPVLPQEIPRDRRGWYERLEGHAVIAVTAGRTRRSASAQALLQPSEFIGR